MQLVKHKLLKVMIIIVGENKARNDLMIDNS